MKIVFMGTSAFAIASLQALINSDYNLVAVFSQPDRPKGRGNNIEPTPVKNIALENNIPVYQPEKIKDLDAIELVKSLEPDIIIVVSYGQIIPVEILEYPKYGCVNVHASLLPKYRGAAPIQRALMAGEKTTGITTMFMDVGLDTGDIIMQLPIEINETINHGELEQVMAEKGSLLLMDTIASIASGSTPRRKQDDSKATYASMITKEDEKINWLESALQICNRIRALNPLPGAYTTINNTKIKLLSAKVEYTEYEGVIGEVVDINNEGFIIKCQTNSVLILEVQKEGKKRINSKDFLRGFNLKIGDIFD